LIALALTLIVGVIINDAARAYPFNALQKQNPIIDMVGGTPLLLVMSEDGKSVRAFARNVDGLQRDFFLQPGSSPLRLIDDKGTEWSFAGTAMNGPLAGKQLARLAVLKDYWFDWKIYHPSTEVFR